MKQRKYETAVLQMRQVIRLWSFSIDDKDFLCFDVSPRHLSGKENGVEILMGSKIFFFVSVSTGMFQEKAHFNSKKFTEETA